MYSHALLGRFKEAGELVALCDINPVRMAYHNSEFAAKFGSKPLPQYSPDQFDTMIRENKIAKVIVTSIDRTHHRYICRAMELGCDVISEKPMTVDPEKCQQVLDAVNRTGKKLTVAFNYRYSPRNSKVKELLMNGAVGQIISVHFEWLLNTSHGADYFRRWHRDKRNSGGLMVHKATHHFDLVNWWINSTPKTVFGMGDLRFYGRENAEERGVTRFYERVHNRANAQGDPFALKMEKDQGLRDLYLNAENADGYIRDQSVFGDNISIEDDMAVMVRYRNKATMSYHLTAYSPWEGWRIAFNGTTGRLEYDVEELPFIIATGTGPHTLAGGDREADKVTEPVRISLRPHWSKPQTIIVPESEGGHGGGDDRLLSDLFIGDQADPLGRAASHMDGAMSILTGIAANKSFATGLPIDVDTLVKF
jgi:predicted dehydrogenase